ncbi:MAG: CapA family protein [Spirochaetales bacterium]|nr:CapA family protein [Spirochaetales bacterium]
MNSIIRITTIILILLSTIRLYADKTPVPENEITLSFVGDIMAHAVNYRVKDYSVMYENVKDLLTKDDLTFGNLETCVNTKNEYSDFPLFKTGTNYVQAVIDGGVDVFSLANNHSYDQGVAGVRETIKAMTLLQQNNRVYFSGLRMHQTDDIKSTVINIKNFKIGFLAVTQYHNMIPREKLIYKYEYASRREKPAFYKLVEKESKKFDLYIISYHGDWEYLLRPNKFKSIFFKNLLKCGADIIYSHGPHVVQPFTVKVDGKVNKLILNSMGNFISGQRYVFNNKPISDSHLRTNSGDSFIIQVTCKKLENSVTITKINPLLITNHQNKKRETIVITLDDVLKFPLSRIWKEYYLKRKKFLEKVLSQSIIPDNILCTDKNVKREKVQIIYNKRIVY